MKRKAKYYFGKSYGLFRVADGVTRFWHDGYWSPSITNVSLHVSTTLSAARQRFPAAFNAKSRREHHELDAAGFSQLAAVAMR